MLCTVPTLNPNLKLNKTPLKDGQFINFMHETISISPHFTFYNIINSSLKVKKKLLNFNSSFLRKVARLQRNIFVIHIFAPLKFIFILHNTVKWENFEFVRSKKKIK